MEHLSFQWFWMVCTGVEGEDIEEFGPKFYEGDAFQCQLERHHHGMGHLFGMNVDVWQCGIQIQGTKEGGSAEAYNLNCDPARKIQPFDFILGVDHLTNMELMKEQLNKHTTRSPQLWIVRPQRVTGIELDKHGSSLGLKLAWKENHSDCLQITAVEGGAARAWNANCSGPDYKLLKNDFIVSVNGVHGTAEMLQEEIKMNDKLELMVLRLPPAIMQDISGGLETCPTVVKNGHSRKPVHKAWQADDMWSTTSRVAHMSLQQDTKSNMMGRRSTVAKKR